MSGYCSIGSDTSQAEFIVEGKLINKCKGEWKVDISDEEIEKKMPKEDVKDKEKLKKIAKKIIDIFDKENRDSDFEYLDYMKIGLWVHKNINYNYEYKPKSIKIDISREDDEDRELISLLEEKRK